jgi:hypothetical protein
MDEVEYLIPSGWHECTPEQVSNGMTISLYLQESTDKAILANYWVGLLKVMFADVPDETFYKLSGEQIYELRPLIRWAVKDRIAKKPFEFFEHDDVKYYLPSENFSDTTCIEMAMASIYYLAYTRKENPDMNAVLLLVGTLCRPQRRDLKEFRLSKEWNGDVREEFNSILIESRSFQKLPIGTVMAVLQYYEFMQEQFTQRYKDDYAADETGETLFPNGDGILALFEEIAETGTHGTFREVCLNNAHTIFMYIRHKLVLNRARAKAQNDQEDD